MGVIIRTNFKIFQNFLILNSLYMGGARILQFHNKISSAKVTKT